MKKWFVNPRAKSRTFVCRFRGLVLLATDTGRDWRSGLRNGNEVYPTGLRHRALKNAQRAAKRQAVRWFRYGLLFRSMGTVTA